MCVFVVSISVQNGLSSHPSELFRLADMRSFKVTSNELFPKYMYSEETLFLAQMSREAKYTQ